MKPHKLSPHIVFPGEPPFRDTMFPPNASGQHFHGTSMAELLAEPPVKSVQWLSAVYGRLVVASTGPVTTGQATPATERLEAAGWLRIAPDADAAAARRHAWPALPAASELEIGVGSLAPKVVIVAEKDTGDRPPMFSKSGVWLFRALRHLGYDELTVYVTTALDDTSRNNGEKLEKLHEAFAAYDPVWIALGPIANEVLDSREIEHLVVEHPAQHRKFCLKSGPEGYAERLKEAGLPRRSLNLVTVVGRPDLAERLGVPMNSSLSGRAMQKRSHFAVPAPVLDKARMKYVLGECKTLKEAAQQATDSKDQQKKIIKLAREQGWEIEREQYYARKREQVKASASEAEAKKVAESRGMAWDNLQKMLAKLNKDLDDPEVPVYAKDAKAMADISLALSEKGDAAFDEEKKRLESLSPEAFTEELRKTMEGFGIQKPQENPKQE